MAICLLVLPRAGHKDSWSTCEAPCKHCGGRSRRRLMQAVAGIFVMLLIALFAGNWGYRKFQSLQEVPRIPRSEGWMTLWTNDQRIPASLSIDFHSVQRTNPRVFVAIFLDLRLLALEYTGRWSLVVVCIIFSAGATRASLRKCIIKRLPRQPKL